MRDSESPPAIFNGLKGSSLKIISVQPVLLPFDMWLALISRREILADAKGDPLVERWPYQLWAKRDQDDGSWIKEVAANGATSNLNILESDYLALNSNPFTRRLRLLTEFSYWRIDEGNSGFPQLFLNLQFEKTTEWAGFCNLSCELENVRQVFLDDLVIPLVQTGRWAKKARAEALKYFVRRWRLAGHTESWSDCFPRGTDHFVFIDDEPDSGWRSMSDAFEAPPEQTKPMLAQKYPQAEMIFGWGYSVFAGLPEEEALASARLIGYVQSSWWQIDYFRQLLSRHSHTLKTHGRRPAATEDFEFFSIWYHNFVVRHASERRNLTPVFYDVFTRLEAAWHMDKSEHDLKELLLLASELNKRRHQTLAEETSRKQQIALGVISLLQVWTLISVLTDYASIQKDSEHKSFLNALLVFLALITPVLAYFVFGGPGHAIAIGTRGDRQAD